MRVCIEVDRNPHGDKKENVLIESKPGLTKGVELSEPILVDIFIIIVEIGENTIHKEGDKQE